MKDALGTRMKRYENVSNFCLTPRSCVIIRIDGKAFHTFTRPYKKPFDPVITGAMDFACIQLFDKVQGSKIVYTQSDEISLLLTDFDTHETQGWYNYELNKIVSISASLVTGNFIREIIFRNLSEWVDGYGDLPAFDSRAFTIPRDDVVNYFLWRIKDCRRNSINGYAQSIFSHKELQGKNCDKVLEMLKESGNAWDDPESRKITDRDRYGFLRASNGDIQIVPEYSYLAEVINPFISFV